MGESRAPYWQTPFCVLATALGVNLLIVTGSFPGNLSVGSATAYAVLDDCDRIRCVGVGQTYASRHRLNEDEGRMNKELPITYLARYEEAAWSPTGQPYWAQPSTEESEQLARRVGSGLRRDDSHQVDASGTMPSTKRKKQNSRTRSI